ncbi:DUF2399 domain-containing protein [Streptomyces sp. CA-294286]|uniref:DUF2399 domain-containing protein n=1 Tax=Streptomyces sp. CA-294286 TaxID=3240070 RepID=UPI003D92210A
MQPTGPVIPVKGLPQGLTAHAVVRTRRAADDTAHLVNARSTGLPHYSHVDLAASSPPDRLDADTVPALSRAGDRTFVLGAQHRDWRAVQQRYQGHAWATAVTLVRAGIVILRCNITESMALGSPVRWFPTAAAARAAEQITAGRALQRDQLRADVQNAQGLLQSWRAADSSLAAAKGLTARDLDSLRSALQTELERPTPAPKRSRILIAVLQDLCDGTVHPNARSFSQTHTGRTKTWDDARTILENCGVTRSVATAVGLYRDSRLGAGGALTLHVAAHSLPLARLRGPLLLRAEQPDLRLSLNGTRLVVVENLQAAETLCDTLDAITPDNDTGTVYCAGMPSRAIVDHIAALADSADRIVIAPDADLGGVRIATAIHQALPPESQIRSTVCDVGAAEHAQQRRWPPDSPIWGALKAARTGPAASLARGCLDRGYPVEQEAAIVECVWKYLL